jgi:hypothetical protein
MVTNNHNPAGGGPPPQATGWGVTIFLVLVIAIVLFTGFESHWL